MFPHPEFLKSATGYIFHWQNFPIRVEVERMRENSRREIAGDITVYHDDELIEQSRINLSSAQGRNSLAKALSERVNNIDWNSALKYVAILSMRSFREGEPAVEIWPGKDDDLAPQYLLEPILYLNHPTVIFGDYGSCKSLMALVIAYVVQKPWLDNPLGLTPKNEPTNCLYLDWEDDTDSFRRRWSAIESGFGKGAMPIIYQRMTSPLCDDVEQVQRIIGDKGIGFVISDSLGPAARGDLNTPEPAIKYLAALRQLSRTSLTLAHTAKDQFTKKRTIFGSVFFTSLARSVWECKAEQETGEDEAFISLKHTKANLSRLQPALGYRFSFEDKAIRLETTDLRDTGLSGELPLAWQIKNLLREGELTNNEIAEALEKGKETVRTTLKRMAKRNQVVKLSGEKWGLAL